MDAITYSFARQNLASTFEKVDEDRTPILVTRKKGDPIVLISLSEYNAMEETAHLLSSPTNAERLAKSIKHLRSGKLNAHDLVEE